MHRIGLTGGIASGKSTVTELLQAAGALILDADLLAHELMQPEGPAYAEILTAFGPDILQPDGQIDRQKLGAHVFENPAALARLNACVHPHVHAALRARSQSLASAAAQADKNWLLISAIPLLYENKLESLFDKVLVVYCSENQQMQRLMARNQLSENAARQRIAAQLPIESKKARADAVIDNSGTLEQTHNQVKQWLGEFSWDTYVV
ncbi:MAG: dephospho-CoA kinase [Candidatus Sericytochromatia bacterium]|nr:dephospho-CoA kinase [Candidatus Sericytochromatia bacterium]